MFYFGTATNTPPSISFILQIKDEAEKARFFAGLTNEKLDTFPKGVCTKKILPELLKAFDYSNAGSQILSPVFKVYIKLNMIV